MRYLPSIVHMYHDGRAISLMSFSSNIASATDFVSVKDASGAIAVSAFRTLFALDRTYVECPVTVDASLNLSPAVLPSWRRTALPLAVTGSNCSDHLTRQPVLPQRVAATAGSPILTAATAGFRLKRSVRRFRMGIHLLQTRRSCLVTAHRCPSVAPGSAPAAPNDGGAPLRA